MKKAIITILLTLTAYTAIFRTEYEKGLCLNEEQDGMVYNADPNYNYISYRRTDAKAGDEVFTVLILNPFNTYCDDYIYRHDWIEVERVDMNFTRDCHGIPFRLVCWDCYDKLMAKGYDGQYYTEADWKGDNYDKEGVGETYRVAGGRITDVPELLQAYKGKRRQGRRSIFQGQNPRIS